MRLAFFHRVGRTWDGETIDREPLGGTQTALTYLTRTLVGLGHEVTVFGEPAQPGTYAGVPYLPSSQLPGFLRENPVEALVSVAHPALLKLGLRVPLHVYWAHTGHCDYAMGEAPDLQAAYAKLLACNVDKVVTVSRWHTEHVQSLFGIPDEQIWTSRNGIDPSVLPPRKPGAPPPRLVYASAPDRGLDVLLQHFPVIRAAVPQAELVICGTLSPWGLADDWVSSQERRLRALADQPGVRWVPGLAKAEMYALWGEARLMAYPFRLSPATNFLAETSCLAALEAQAMGVPVVTSHSGGLPETVADGISGWVLKGPVESEAYRQALLSRTIELLTDDALWLQMSEQAQARIRREYDWRDIAREFVDAVGEWRQAPSTRQTRPPITARLPKPETSVVVTTYNESAPLRQTLESLCQQEGGPIEVLVCDNGSNDDSYAVAHTFTDRLNLRYFFQPYDGTRLAASRNLGMQLARGDVVIFADAGTIVPSGFVQAHRQAHRSGSVAAVSRVQSVTVPEDVAALMLPAAAAEGEETTADLMVVSFKTKELLDLGGFYEPKAGWRPSLLQRMASDGVQIVQLPLVVGTLNGSERLQPYT